MGRAEAFGLAWSGTEIYNDASYEGTFCSKFPGEEQDTFLTKSNLNFGRLPYLDIDFPEPKGTPNCS